VLEPLTTKDTVSSFVVSILLRPAVMGQPSHWSLHSRLLASVRVPPNCIKSSKLLVKAAVSHGMHGPIGWYMWHGGHMPRVAGMHLPLLNS